MISKIAQKRKNLNSSARRTRVVCFHEKEAFKNVNFGSKIELKHGPNFHNDHNVIEVYADGVFIGHVIHQKRKGDEMANILNNDEIIHLVQPNMVVNIVTILDNQLLIDIPINQRRR